MILEHVAWWFADRLADGRSVAESGTHRAPQVRPDDHNHPTLVILAPGYCPACDAHHWAMACREVAVIENSAGGYRRVTISRSR